MIRSFRYRLVPTKMQDATLRDWLRLTRELYNAALQERREAWKKQHISVTAFDQMKQLASVRDIRPEFDEVPIVVQRGAIRRLDKAFAGFFRRCKSGEKPGYPRFKGRDRWASILVDDLSGKNPIDGKRHVKVPLIGKVKFKQHRLLMGTPKAMRLTLDAGGRWFITFACIDVPAEPLPATRAVVGVDLGLLTFASTSDGTMYENPRPLRVARLHLERAQRRVARRKCGSKRRRRAVVLLAKKYARVANVRRENSIGVARSLVACYDTIFVEDLNIKGLARGMFAESVTDAGWGNFLHWLDCKAESAGRKVVKVNPRGTSQNCSGCGTTVEKSLSVRVHRCAACGLVIDRDVNAACNILGLGQSPQGAAPVVIGRRRSAQPNRQLMI